MAGKFNPNEWLDLKAGNNNLNSSSNRDKLSTANNDIESNIEEIVKQIELSKIDITDNYSDWTSIGFALTSEFGEAGRDFFHRISHFNLNYFPPDCDLQFDKCLKSNKEGITIKTLFHLANEANIIWNTKKTPNHIAKKLKPEIASGNGIKNTFNTPQFPVDIYEHLPEILKESTDMFTNAIEKDVLLMGSLSVLSACLPNIEGNYFDEPYSPHLYLFITAPAGSGKGKLKWAKYFGLSIHKEILKVSNYQKKLFTTEMEAYQNLNKNEKKGKDRPIEPKQYMFYIPANSSSSAFIQALADNSFKGIVFETEADTLANTLKQDWGNFSDVLRKAFHHESTNMFRRKDNEYIEIEDPHVSIVLSGTPKQVHSMIPDTENGLFSRFSFYAFEDHGSFNNPFKSHAKVNYTDFFEEQGRNIYQLYQELQKLKTNVDFKFTQKQGEEFTEKFRALYTRNRLLLGNDFNANSQRLGLITFRLAMILSSLRILEHGDLSSPMICSEIDFQTAMSIAFTLEKHAIAVFKNLPDNNLKGRKFEFFEALPNNFNRQEYLNAAKNLLIKDKTAEKYIGQFKEIKLLEHEHNKYTKTKNRM